MDHAKRLSGNVNQFLEYDHHADKTRLVSGGDCDPLYGARTRLAHFFQACTSAHQNLQDLSKDALNR